MAELVDSLLQPRAPGVVNLLLSDCKMGWLAGKSLARLLVANTPSSNALQVSRCFEQDRLPVNQGRSSPGKRLREDTLRVLSGRRSQALSLDNNQRLGDRGGAAVAEAIAENCCMLTRLDVSRCGLTENSAASLSNLLALNRTLITLWAADNNFRGEAGTRMLGSSLAENSTLQV